MAKLNKPFQRVLDKAAGRGRYRPGKPAKLDLEESKSHEAAETAEEEAKEEAALAKGKKKGKK